MNTDCNYLQFLNIFYPECMPWEERNSQVVSARLNDDSVNQALARIWQILFEFFPGQVFKAESRIDRTPGDSPMYRVVIQNPRYIDSLDKTVKIIFKQMVIPPALLFKKILSYICVNNIQASKQLDVPCDGSHRLYFRITNKGSLELVSESCFMQYGKGKPEVIFPPQTREISLVLFVEMAFLALFTGNTGNNVDRDFVKFSMENIEPDFQQIANIPELIKRCSRMFSEEGTDRFTLFCALGLATKRKEMDETIFLSLTQQFPSSWMSFFEECKTLFACDRIIC